MYTLLAGMDEYYSKNLASNVKRALKMNANNCQFNGGIPPLGYKIVDKKYVINEDEAKIIKDIFQLYLDGKGIYEIANTLNDKGYTTRKGQAFGKNSIYDIIGNERYTGTYIFNKGTKNNHDNNGNIIKIENGIPAIITKEAYNKAMELRQRNKIEPGTKKNKFTYILSGLVYCGECGARYVGKTSKNKKLNGNIFYNGYYICANRNGISLCKNDIISQPLLENFIITKLLNEILGKKSFDDLVEQIKLEYNKLKSNIQNDSSAIEKQLKDLQIKKNNLINVIAVTGNADLVNELSNYNLKISKLENDLQFTKKNNINNISAEKIATVFQQDIKLLKNGSKEELKKLVKKYVKRITIYKDKLIIDFSFTNTPIISNDIFSFCQGTTSRYQLKGKQTIFCTQYCFDISVIKKKE